MIKPCLFALALVLGAGAPALAQAEPKAAYDEICVSCHRQPQRLAARIVRTDEGRRKLDAFLATHFAPDQQKREAVIEYIYSVK